MRIGIDIDNTLLDSDNFINQMIKKINSNSTDHFDSSMELTANDIEIYQPYLIDIVRNIPAFANAKEVLDFFHEMGITIVIITARDNTYSSQMEEETVKRLQNLGLYYDKIIFDQDDKSRACLDEKIDLFIDDTETVLDGVAAVGVKTLRYSQKPIESNHEVVHSWLEVKEYVLKMRGEQYERKIN